MTAVTVAKQPDPRALLDPLRVSPQWLTSSLSAVSADFRPTIPEASALTVGQRRTVEKMEARLGERLQPATDEQVAVTYSVLKSAFPGARLEPEEARANAAAYLMALDGVPAFALEEAVKQVLRGNAGINRSFMPTAPELRAIADRLALPARAHAVALRRLQEASVVTRAPAAPRELPEAVKAFLATPFQSENTGAA